MARVVKKGPLTEAEIFENTAGAYLAAKVEVDQGAKRVKALRDILVQQIDSLGENLEGGHWGYSFSSPIGDFAGMKKERRATPELDEEKAMEILREKGLLDLATKTITVIDEEAVFGLLQDELLTEVDIDEMFPVKVTWALKTEKIK